jgi:hypothetical protein
MARSVDPTTLRDRFAGCRYDPSSSAGHYESYFLRANHPSRPLAFWIRYTLFSPKKRPKDAVGELWAIAFDREAGKITAVKSELPLGECAFSRRQTSVLVGAARLDDRELAGEASSRGHSIGWDLAYEGGGAPLLLYPERMYDASFPKAKAMVLAPNAIFRGTVTVDGVPMRVDGWQGSANHNWGRAHTDAYAWGQVAGFDGEPDAFLEVATARVKIGPLWTPRMTPVVLRVGGDTIALNSVTRVVRTKARYELFEWTFEAKGRGVSVRGTIDAPRDAFVALTYPNPPGGKKTCLNSKIARCVLRVERKKQPPLELVAANRAAFEILTDASDHGVPLAV